ncbi:MAG: hypothetical protein A2Y10_00070 [Planctomycetes bacterium GWF2_41_51]|nr:MAG: hypothetical protein A2Y10_00070 [Planctomycetes bacterium GWF2_41_51]
MRTHKNELTILIVMLSNLHVLAVSFMAIGKPPGFISNASGISTNYTVVGDGERSNWIWTTGTYSLGPGPIVDISEDGSIMIANVNSGGGDGFYKVVHDAVQTIGGYAHGFNKVKAISSDGSKIVGDTDINNSDQHPAWSYQNGVYTILPLPTGFTGDARAEAISSNGTVIAGNIQSHNSDITETVLWQNGYIEILPNPENVTFSQVLEIAGNGSVIVGFYRDTNIARACVWQNGMIETLPMLTGVTNSIATGSSFDGSIIFGNFLEGPGTGFSPIGAFIWDELNGTRLLKDFLENDYGLDLTGWNLLSVSATDASGNIITGYGINPQGQEELWIATIPEPGTIILFVVGGLMLQRKRI